MQSQLVALFIVVACAPTLQAKQLGPGFLHQSLRKLHATASKTGRHRAAPHTSSEGGFSMVASIPPWAQVTATMTKQTHVKKKTALPGNVTWYGLMQEDEYAHRIFFSNLDNGKYLDLGAHEGTRCSNTKAISESFGWRGILIEANPNLFSRLVKNRPNDICVHSAVCANSGTVHYVLPQEEFVGGIWELMAPSFLQEWHPHLADGPEGLREVSCLPLSAILDKFNVRHINFFSLDVEGGELSVLQTLDFGRVTFDVIVVEADSHNATKNQQVVDLLASHGYTLHGHIKANAWFVNSAFKYAS